MKKTLAFSMIAATVFGGMLLSLPAEAHCHHFWRRFSNNYNYNTPMVTPAYTYNSYPMYSPYYHVPLWYRIRSLF